MNRLKYYAPIAICLLAASCGDGGDDDEARFLAGIWTGAITLNENTCNLTTPSQTLSFTHNVAQNETAITLNDGSVTYLGNAVGENGFSVDANGLTFAGGPGNVCTFSTRIEYDQVNDDNDNSADVNITSTGPCTSNPSCQVRYIGTAVRGTNPGTGVTTSTTTTLQAGGGCLGLQNKTYTGTGLCGVTTTALSSSGNAVTLTGVGGQGAVGFAPTGDPNVFSSTRNDLTVNGHTATACSITCEAPTTFTLNCTSADAATCSEKF